MSYILEALKKSEQERGAGNSPSVQTIHSAGLQYAQQKKPLWPYILAAVITLNVIALIVMFAPSGNQAASQPTAKQTTPAPASKQPVSIMAPKTVTQPAAPSAAVTVQPPATSPAPTVAAGAAQRADRPAPQAAPGLEPGNRIADNYQASISKQSRNDYVSVVDVRDLPMHIQARIPDMVFSAHVYSSNPQQRSVVINGNFMEQGDMLTPRLRLDEITPGGVVFDFEGTRFRTSVLSNWKLN